MTDIGFFPFFFFFRTCLFVRLFGQLTFSNSTSKRKRACLSRMDGETISLTNCSQKGKPPPFLYLNLLQTIKK